MRFNHFTFTVGSSACNAKCPFCVSKMTGIPNEPLKEPNWDKFAVACGIAKSSPELTTALLSSKGELTLHPELVSQYLSALKMFGEFPVKEIQTNGIIMSSGKIDKYLDKWKVQGLTTIAISVVHYNQKRNSEIYGGEHFDLFDLVDKLHNLNFSVRICCMLVKKYIDSSEEVSVFTDLCYAHGVEQFTIRPIEVPSHFENGNESIVEWTKGNTIPKNKLENIVHFVKSHSVHLLDLDFGASVYGMQTGEGKQQNICMSNCLTETEDPNKIRQLIFFSEGRGRIGWSWTNTAATIL
jgi:pyruvate-formate lyase-activating enzyme